MKSTNIFLKLGGDGVPGFSIQFESRVFYSPFQGTTTYLILRPKGTTRDHKLFNYRPKRSTANLAL